MRNRSVFALLLGSALASWPGPAAAQTPPERVSFDDAVQRAMDKNPTIAEAATAIVRAEGLLQQARSATLPLVSASLSSATVNSSPSFNGTNISPRTQVTFGADISMPVLAASRWAARTQALDQVDVSRLSLADVRRQVAVSTAQAYLTVIAQNRQVEVNQRALDAAKAHLDYAQKRLDSGAGSRLDQLRAAQEVATDQSRLENALLGVRRAQEALGVLVAAPGPVDVSGEPTFDLPASVDEAAWMQARTDIKLFGAQQRATERVLHDSSKEWLPTVTASFDPQYVTPTGFFQLSRTWRFSVAVSQPIFDSGERASLRQQRQAAVDSSAQVLANAELQARSDVRTAQDSVQSFQRALDSARLAAQQAADVLQITTVAFQAGATTNLEVIDAERSARDADTAAAQAEDAVRQARLQLLVAVGRFPK